MSEEREEYKINRNISKEEKTKLYWLAKRMIDIAKDLEKLDEEEKQFVIERAKKQDKSRMVVLYNTISEYFDDLGFDLDYHDFESEYHGPNDLDILPD